MLLTLVPGKMYDPQEVRSGIGSKAGEEDFVVGSDVVALFARVGAASGIGFPDRSTLEWPGKLPKQVVRPSTKLLIFVYAGLKAVRFLGDGCVTSFSSGKGLPCQMQFAIRPALTRSTWLELIKGRIPTEGPPPEEPFTNLAAKSSPREQWAALTVFIERWYGKPATGMPTNSNVGPPLLRNTLGPLATSPEVFKHNHLVPPSELAIEGGKVVFLVENQAVCLWATEPEGEDPKVWYRNNEEGEPWIEEPQRLSGFLIQAVLFEAILNAQFGAYAIALPDDLVGAILDRVKPLARERWNWNGARFFARDGALVMTMKNNGANDVWLAARTPFALSCFEDLVSEEWDRVAF